jgi:DNA-binding transcriptional MerR regulator
LEAIKLVTSFNSKTVSKIIGIPIRVIDYWDRTNFIKPSINEATGYGSVRLYSFTDLIQFKVAKFLRDQGLSLQKIRKSLHYLRKHLPEVEIPLAQLRFLTNGETIFVLTNKEKVIIDTLKRGQYVLAIAIEELINELKRKTSKIKMEKIYEVSISKRKFKVKLHPDVEQGGYWVKYPEFPGCASRGDSIEETLDRIKETIKIHLEVEGKLEKKMELKKKVA